MNRIEPDELEKLPPHSAEAERGLIGCILLSAREVLSECISVMGTDGSYFYDLRYQIIYQTCCELSEDRINVDVITLYERLGAWGKLDQVGGLAFIQELPEAVPTSAFATDYIRILREKYLFRKLVRVGTETVSKAFNWQGDVGSLIDEVERDVLKIGQERQVIDTPPIRVLVQEVLNDMESAQQRGTISGLSTGFPDLDRITQGLHAGDMTIIAARPSLGKTSLAMNIAEYVACEAGLPVGIFSLEMTGKALINRMVCSRAQVNSRNVNGGFLSESDMPKLAVASSRISAAPLYIDDRSSLSVMQVRAKARRWYQEFGIRLIVADYLQLMTSIGSKRRYESRQLEITDISGGMKALAKELNIPVVVLSQLNRGVENDKNRIPRLSDLRESGSIEQDADLVGLLYRPRTSDDDSDDPAEMEFSIPVNFHIGKQRNGPAGVDVNFTFIKPFTRFRSAAREQEAPEPVRAAAGQQQFPD